MYNYEHEIPCPENLAMRKFLWSDYFHDSVITNIYYGSKSKRNISIGDVITLKLQCNIDYEHAWENQCKKRNIPTDYTDLFNEKYTYILSFYGVKYHQFECGETSMEYLNGRFKNTHLLHLIEQKSCHPLYHFRIQVTNGYMDVVFRKFQVRKAMGRVNYLTKGYSFDSKKHSISEEELHRIHNQIVADNYEDDFDYFMDLQKLYNGGDKELLKYLRICLNSNQDSEAAKPYAAYLLGKVGETCDVPLAQAVYFQSIDRLQKLHIMDGIDLLLEEENC